MKIIMVNQKRFNVFGTRLSCIDKKTAFEELSRNRSRDRGYLSFPDSNVVASAYKNKKLRTILNNSWITFTDGKFTEFYAKLKGENQIQNISAYDLLDHLLESDKTHYFYGLRPKELLLLKHQIKNQHPNANVLGYKSPPFLNLEKIENNDQIKKDIEEINSLRPDFIWIGISSPKQDYLMNYYVKDLDHGIMIGVGAVLLYKAGILNKGPQWIKNLGMRWLFRFVQEPVRVWKKKSIQNIFLFVILIVKHDLLRIKQPNSMRFSEE